MTWWCRASSASVLPRAAPSRPPTPVSISSRTRVATRSVQASTVLAARVTRESSPPEAIFRSGRGTSPGLARKSISTRSAPTRGARSGRVVAQVAGLDLDGEPCFLQAQRLEPRLDRPAEVLGRLPPRGRERGRGRLERLERLGQGCVQVLQVLFVPLDRGELGLGLDSPRGELVGRAMEPRRQPPVERQPSLDLLEPRRVVVPALPEVAQAVGHLAGLVGQPLEGRDGLGQLGHRVRQRLQAARDPLEHLLGGVIGLVEQVVALGRGRAQRLGVGQQVRVAHQLVVLAEPGIGAASSSRSNSSRARSRCRAWVASSRAWRFAAGRRGRPGPGDTPRAARPARRRRRAGRAGGPDRAGPVPRSGRGCRPAARPAAGGSRSSRASR